jgi:hypothetical protein
MIRTCISWLRHSFAQQRATRARRTSRPRPSNVPQFLVLEDRTVLSVLTVLNNADSGDGSLRAAIAAAQSGDTIVFDPRLAYQTITLSSGPLALSSNLTIDGLGANQLAISGNSASQLFTLSGTAEVALANLTLAGGMSSQGGAVFIGGTAALTLDSDILSGNQAMGDANGNALGGAVYSSAGARLTIDNTSFVNNQTKGTNESFGGAIINAGTLTITGAAFTGNAALGSTTIVDSTGGGCVGGAVFNAAGSTVTIQQSTFTGNQVLATGAGSAAGGAICNSSISISASSGAGISCTLSQCTFDNNTAEGGSTTTDSSYAGALEDGPGIVLAVLNCSFTGNQANSGGGPEAEGGAIDNSTGDSITISGSQFISNSAIGSGTGATAVGGAVDNFQTMTIANSIFTGNSAVGGPMADGVNTSGEALGGAIFTGEGLSNGVPMVILTISNSILAGNEAIGGSDGSANPAHPTGTASAAGGGIAQVRGGTSNVAGCTITGNQAIGGATASGTGGVAFGGGIDNFFHCTLNLTNSVVSTNLCKGGAGASGAEGGAAFGAGIANEYYSTAILTNSTISLNESLGGAGANGGVGLGGGISNAAVALVAGVSDASSLVVSNCQIVGNMAQGGAAGSGNRGGEGLGGGLFAGSGTIVLKVVLVSGNRAQGGADSNGNTTGQGLGGGVYVDPSATATADMETFIAGNQASKNNNDVWGTITPGP